MNTFQGIRNPDVAKRAEALVAFLAQSGKYAPSSVKSHGGGVHGGSLFIMEDGSEFYVMTDAEADVALRGALLDYMENSADAVRLDRASYLPDEDHAAACDAQERGDNKSVAAILKRHIDAAFANEKRLGRGYLLSAEDGAEHEFGGFYIYRAV